MRRRTDAAEVGFTARISERDKKDIESLYPMSGGKRWLIETALEEFLGVCSGNTRFISWVNDQVMQMREDGRPPERMVDFLPRVNTELYKKFNDLFPQKGATTWFIRCFIKQHIDDSDGLMTPEEVVQRSVRKLLSPAIDKKPLS